MCPGTSRSTAGAPTSCSSCWPASPRPPPPSTPPHSSSGPPTSPASAARPRCWTPARRSARGTRWAVIGCHDVNTELWLVQLMLQYASIIIGGALLLALWTRNCEHFLLSRRHFVRILLFSASISSLSSVIVHTNMQISTCKYFVVMLQIFECVMWEYLLRAGSGRSVTWRLHFTENFLMQKCKIVNSI